MPSFRIPDPETLRQEIQASHDRCRQYGVDATVRRNARQLRLADEDLAGQIAANQEFLSVATRQIEELYHFVAGAGFAVTIADAKGYILHMIGDEPILERLRAGNCCPGYRWTEEDVGTSVISLALERRIAVQINDDEHFCQRGYGHTCSGAPVFDPEDRLAGVIAMSGEASQVHPHTLGMVVTAARAIEHELRIQRASRELLLRNSYMAAIFDAIDSGVMAVGPDGLVTQVNENGRRILHWPGELAGQSIDAVVGGQLDWQALLRDGSGLSDREVLVRGMRRAVHLLLTARPIVDGGGAVQGIILVFQEIHRIRKLVSEMAGAQARFTFADIVGASPAIEEAKKLAMLAAAGASTVLLLGETGTGKELFAQAIHNQGERRAHPFVAINCGAIPRELLESELFGYADGAFTGARKGGRPGKFELASGGTVFLDEIGDMPTDMQVKLLRVLQTGEVFRIGEHKPIAVDLRVIAATHVDLRQEVLRGNFREDLFYRLNVFPIRIPPLRERPQDLTVLARHILARCGQTLRKPDLVLSPESEAALARHDWPGNVRELANAVERAANLVDGRTVEPHLLGLPVRSGSRRRPHNGAGRLLEEAERETIRDVLESTGFNVARSARTLGITRATLYKKMEKYRLAPA